MRCSHIWRRCNEENALTPLEQSGTATAVETSRLEKLERIWRDPSGFWGWFTHVNHRSIGKRFIVSAFSFFPSGWVLAALMPIQPAPPKNHFPKPHLYNQIFTVHGSTMMFLFAVPMMFEALAVYL